MHFVSSCLSQKQKSRYSVANRIIKFIVKYMSYGSEGVTYAQQKNPALCILKHGCLKSHY